MVLLDGLFLIGKSQKAWSQTKFGIHMRQELPHQVGDLSLVYSKPNRQRATIKKRRDNNGVAIPSPQSQSQPDFALFHGPSLVGWTNVELLMEHSSKSYTDTTHVNEVHNKWCKNAEQVFRYQPFRRFLLGILFIRPVAYISYLDHTENVLSSPLLIMQERSHTILLQEFLTAFIAQPDHRGQNLDARERDGDIYFAQSWWHEIDVLYYKPLIHSRHVRVAVVEPTKDLASTNQGQKSSSESDAVELSASGVVMKTSWEYIPPVGAPPSTEVDILKVLFEANVKGLPYPYYLDKAVVGDSHGTVTTARFPDYVTHALPAKSNGRSRQLTQVMLSYCQPLTSIVTSVDSRMLMRIVRDAAIVYYDAYISPDHGFLHGDISPGNIVIPLPNSALTGGITSEDRAGSLIDWNLAIDANGMTNSHPTGGTPGYTSPWFHSLGTITCRRLAHDMDSFFLVLLQSISVVPNELRAEHCPAMKFLKAVADLHLGPEQSIPQSLWTSLEAFMARKFAEDIKFLICMKKLGNVLCTGRRIDETVEEDRIRFRECMKVFDSYFGDYKGETECKNLEIQRSEREDQNASPPIQYMSGRRK
ncbi:hypothetical protein AOQ84DRAFT_375730 [Glonium stellatum]|uniref:Fungal-type protein kinase domain-containing protein n=1 Tax=Glonium stellatum TaxID=574774 RepID=A0A8E2JUD2_9PEZI|nr:hypothetical protein AOQ84DRAFT_375730 [Glonium stellatum]